MGRLLKTLGLVAQVFPEDTFLEDCRNAALGLAAKSRVALEAIKAVSNARAVLKLQEELGSLDRYLWSFVGGRPIVNRWKEMKQVPATSPESDALSKDLKKRGFRFVGSTIIYAHMQATGMVNDHVVSCFRHAACRQLR